MNRLLDSLHVAGEAKVLFCLQDSISLPEDCSLGAAEAEGMLDLV